MQATCGCPRVWLVIGSSATIWCHDQTLYSSALLCRAPLVLRMGSDLCHLGSCGTNVTDLPVRVS